jgi:hypothetical protein
MASSTSPSFSAASVRQRSATPVAAGKPHTRVRISPRVNPPRLLGLFSLEPSYVEQVDQHLGELLDSPT